MSQIKQAGWVTLRIDGRGVVLWCDDWAALMRLALQGHTNVKIGPRGEPFWVG